MHVSPSWKTRTFFHKRGGNSAADFSAIGYATEIVWQPGAWRLETTLDFTLSQLFYYTKVRVAAAPSALEPIMCERRKRPRTLTLKTAKIIIATGVPAIDCAILDETDRGARILVADAT
jgi:hypothetical protein